MDKEEDIWKLLENTLKILLSLFGLITGIGLFIAYYILTEYMIKIEFLVGALETHLLFSIAKYIIILFFAFCILLMGSTFFPLNELKKYDKDVLIKLLWTSSLMIIIFLVVLGLIVEYCDLSSLQILISSCVLFAILAIVEYSVIIKIVNKETVGVVLWQVTYSLTVYAFLLSLLLKIKIEWISIVIIYSLLIIMHAYPYVFILFSSKQWIKKIYIFLFSFPLIALLLFFNSFSEASIRASGIGGITYKEIKIKEDECKSLNENYDSKPCKLNRLTNMEGLWLQGKVQYFQDENGKYKVKTDNIIYKIKDIK